MPTSTHDEMRKLGISPLETGTFGLHSTPGMEPSPNIGKVAVSFANVHLTNTGTYLSARINELKKGDLVEVALSGSARDSEFYYAIQEVTGNTDSVIPNEQIIMNTGQSWLSIGTSGLFEVIRDGIVVFSAQLRKGDVSGRVTVFQLGLIAKVVGKKRG